jgi:hypothetical protein
MEEPSDKVPSSPPPSPDIQSVRKKATPKNRKGKGPAKNNEPEPSSAESEVDTPTKHPKKVKVKAAKRDENKDLKIKCITTNPKNVRVIGEKIFNSVAAVAGYVGCPQVTDLEQILGSDGKPGPLLYSYKYASCCTGTTKQTH